MNQFVKQQLVRDKKKMIRIFTTFLYTNLEASNLVFTKCIFKIPTYSLTTFIINKIYKNDTCKSKLI